MDGDSRQPRFREPAQRLIVDAAPRSGIVARVFRSIGGLVPLRLRRPPADRAALLETLPEPRRRLPWTAISFVAMVLIPAAIFDIYFVFLASDQYVAETRAVVRSVEQEAQAQTAVGSSGAPSSLSLSMVTPNAYIVTNYLRSRGIVDHLGATVDLRAIFRRPEADFWARLPSDATIEELVDYWNSMVTTYVDGPSGIITVKIRAFRRDDSLVLAQAVVRLSEQLVNEISERARRDSMQFAEREVQRADVRVRTALDGLRRYRDEERLIDPVKAADETSKLLMQLMAEKIRLESDLFVASRSMARTAPPVQTLSARLEIIEIQITKLRENLTGDTPEVRNIAAKLARFEELEVQRQFAERLYMMAQDGLERARMTAERQSVYLTVFVPPSLPEESTFPHRLSFSLLAPLALLVVWSILALGWASVQDHRT